MNVTTVDDIYSRCYATYATGVGWLGLDQNTGMFDPITPEEMLHNVARKYLEVTNAAALECHRVGIEPKRRTPAAVDLLKDAEKKAHLEWAFANSLTDSKVLTEGMKMLQGKSTIANMPDADDWLLGTPDGVLDLMTGDVLDRQDAARRLVTRRTNVVPAAAVTPEFLAVLECIPAEQRDYVRWHLARSLVGEMARGMFIHIGSGANGKSMLIGCLAKALGTYSVQIDSAALGGGTASYQLADLRGARMCYMEELEAEAAVKPTVWKMLVSTPTLTARQIYGRPVTFRNTWTMAVCTNYAPTVDTGDGGASRRARIIPWPTKYVTTPTRPNERPIDITDVDGWVCNGQNQAMMLRWLLDVVHDPEPVTPQCLVDARGDWTSDNDVIGMFMAHQADTNDGGGRVTLEALSNAYGRWRHAKDYGTMAERKRYSTLKAWLYQVDPECLVKVANVQYVIGYTLRPDVFEATASGWHGADNPYRN